MVVLVTGGCGLIGYHAARYYKDQGHEVWVLDNFERSRLLGHEVSPERMLYNYQKLREAGVYTITQDVSVPETFNPKVIPPPDLILHFAAQCGVPTSVNDPRRDFEVNALGTLNVLEYAREHGSRVCYASTNKVYPLHEGWILDDNRWRWADDIWHQHGFPKDAEGLEHLLHGSRTPYGASKYYGDMLCQEYYHMYGVPTGVFRMSCIYGDHQFGFSEQGWATWFAIATLKKLPITIYGDGKQVRDMLWVGDTVKAYDAFATQHNGNIEHGIWNLGGGPEFTISLDECLDILEDITGMRSPVTYEDWRPSDQRVYTSDIRAVGEDLGWKPTVSPREGLARVVTWAETCLDIF